MRPCSCCSLLFAAFRCCRAVAVAICSLLFAVFRCCRAVAICFLLFAAFRCCRAVAVAICSLLFAICCLINGGRGIRTPKGASPADFKSAALPVRASPPRFSLIYTKTPKLSSIFSGSQHCASLIHVLQSQADRETASLLVHIISLFTPSRTKTLCKKTSTLHEVWKSSYFEIC